jgi:hypothetical protein
MTRELPILALAFTLSLIGFTEARAKHLPLVESAVSAYEQQHSYQVPAAGSVEVAFSPDEGSEHLVLKVIDSAQAEICMLSYSFTSAPVVDALIRARHRGVAVTLVDRDTAQLGSFNYSAHAAHAKLRERLGELAQPAVGRGVPCTLRAQLQAVGALQCNTEPESFV